VDKIMQLTCSWCIISASSKKEHAVKSTKAGVAVVIVVIALVAIYSCVGAYAQLSYSEQGGDLSFPSYFLSLLCVAFSPFFLILATIVLIKILLRRS